MNRTIRYMTGFDFARYETWSEAATSSNPQYSIRIPSTALTVAVSRMDQCFGSTWFTKPFTVKPFMYEESEEESS